jgi:uncharacterized delta-60 repeat protein
MADMSGRRVLLSLLMALVLVPLPANAASLDPTWNRDGLALTQITSGLDVAHGIAVQADGKVVAAGTGGFGEFAVARYGPGGRLDDTFDGDGRVTTDLTDGPDWANAAALQEDGKIVAAGTAGFRRFALVRYGTDGDLDPEFGDGGVLITNVVRGDDDEVIEDIVLQPDGKIVVAGFVIRGGGFRFTVARYETDGDLDPSFSEDGKVITRFTERSDEAQAVALQDDGKIVAAGTANNHRFAVARYETDGTLDTTFGGDGMATANLVSGQGFEVANDVAIQADGKIVAAGEAGAMSREISSRSRRIAEPGSFAVVRFDDDGSLDTAFGGDGSVATSFSRRIDRARSVAIQSDGKIVAIGSAGEKAFGDSDVRFALARYDPDGSLDDSFGGDGRILTNPTPKRDIAYEVALDGDRILAAGRTGGFDSRFAVARYTE